MMSTKASRLVVLCSLLLAPAAPSRAGEIGSMKPPDLETPQASLENFLDSCRRGDYERAALSLDLRSVDPAWRGRVGSALARQLKEVMDEQVWFHWDDVPDRPDGIDDRADSQPKENPGPPTRPRGNFKLYSLNIGDQDYEIRLERVRADGGAPVWVFSRQTVEHIPALHRQFAPKPLVRTLPAALRERRFAKVALWQWIGFTIILLAGGALGWVVQMLSDVILRRLDSAWARGMADVLRGPGALGIGLWVCHALAWRYLALAGPILSTLDPVFIVAFTIGLVWLLQRLIRVATLLYSRPYEAANSDDANVLLTRITVLRHALTFTVVVGGAIYALTRFEWFRQVGSTILASAGVAGLILGIAAQRVLGNLFAGLLLAVAQPVKAGDALLFEKEFGWIEEISLTYLVIRLWDSRRIVVPITYLMDHPVQNWSRKTQKLMLPVYLQADYRVDVNLVRKEFERIMEESKEWDRTVPPILQVTGSKEDTLELRALCSAADPGSSWNLQCRVREGLVAFLRDHEGGRFLPRKRVAMVGEDLPSAGRHDAAAGNGQPAPEVANGR